MSVTQTCPANQRKGPYAASAGSIVGLAVTAGGSAYVQYTEQPPTQQSAWVTWPNGSTTAQAPELDVSMYNALVMVVCTAGTATLTISDPDDINFRAAVDWKSQIATQGSLPTPQILAGLITSDGTNASFAKANTATSAVSTFAVPFQYPGGDILIGPDWVAPMESTAASLINAYNYSSSHGMAEMRLAPGSTYALGTTQVRFTDTGGTPLFDGVRSVPDIICHGGMAIIDCGGQTAKTGGLYYNMASGIHCYAKIQNVIFQSAVVAIELDGVNGLTIDHCEFSACSTAVWFHNKTAGRFTEFNTVWNSVFRTNTKLALEYTIDNGVTSFHGSGLMPGNIINVGSDHITPILVASTASGSSQPYNAPMYFNMFGGTAQTSSIFETHTPGATFYGHIQVESPSFVLHAVDPACNGVIGFAGDVTVLSAGQFVVDNPRQFLLAHDLQQMANGSVARRGWRYSQQTTCAWASTTQTGLDRCLTGCEVTVTTLGSSNTYAQIDVLNIALAGTNPTIRVRNCFSNDPLNSGSPQYFLNASGTLIIGMPSGANAINVTTQIDARWIGQDPFNNDTIAGW